jgi:hypothetical protein
MGAPELVNAPRLVGQGDDDSFISPNVASLVKIYIWYSRVGPGAHKQKNFLARFSEYLRKVVGKDGTTGYLARKMLGLIYRNPDKQEPVQDELHVRELAAMLNVCTSRDADLERLAFSFEMEVRRRVTRRKTNGSVRDILDWISTPTTVGGVGVTWMPPGRWIKATQRKVEKSVKMVKPSQGCYAGMVARTSSVVGQFNWEKEVVGALFPEGMEPVRSTRLFVEPALLVAPARWKPGFTSVLKDMSAGRVPKQFTFEDKLLFFEVTAERLISSRSWSMLLDLCSVQSKDYFSALFKSCERDVFIDYVLGKLPSVSPLVAGWSSDAVSVFCNDALWQAWTVMLSKFHRIDKRLVLEFYLACEIETVSFLQSQPIKLGT